MRRIYSATLAALTVALVLVGLGAGPPAAQAGHMHGFLIVPDSCGPSFVRVSLDNFRADRDNTGTKYEEFRIVVSDGAGTRWESDPHREVRGYSTSSVIDTLTPGGPSVNPIKAEVVSSAGNGLQELILASAELYCPNLPGSIVTTAANLTYPDAADVSDTLAPFVQELSGTPVTYSVKTPPVTGTLAVNPYGAFTYQWGTHSAVSFDVTVRNTGGQEQVLPVTLQRKLSAPITLTPSDTEVTFGDPVGITALLSAEDAALPPTGTITFTSKSDNRAWVYRVGVDGGATLVLETLPVGVHTFSAYYSGDSNYSVSIAEPVTVTVSAKEEPGTGEPECAEGESLNDEGECVTTGTEGEGGEGENPDGEGGNPDGEGGNPDGEVKPNPLTDADKKPATQSVEKPAKTVPAPIANTGAESSVWLAGVSVLAVAAGVSLVARRRRV